MLIATITLVIIVITFSFLYFKETEKPGIIDSNGQIRGTEVNISSKVTGSIEKLLIKEGQKIEKGELIAKLSSQQIEAKIEQAKARIDIYKAQKEVVFHNIHQAKAALKSAESSIEEAQARLNLASKNYKRYSELAHKGIISQSQLDNVETALKAARAKQKEALQAKEEVIASIERSQSSQQVAENQLSAARAELKEIEATYSDTKIHSPIDGTVINKLVEEGELVVEGTPIANIIDLSDLYVKVYIPEKEIGKIRLGNPVKIYSDAFPNKSFKGSVIEVSQEAEFTPKEVHMKEERTKLVFGIKVKIENPKGYLKPGMPVDVMIKWDEDAKWRAYN